MSSTGAHGPYYHQFAEFSSNPENYHSISRDPLDSSIVGGAGASDHVSLYGSLSNDIHGGPPEASAIQHQYQHGQKRQQHIDGNLLEAVTSAAGEQVALEQLRNVGSDGDQQQGYLSRTEQMDRQQRTAEEAVSLLSPTLGAGEGRHGVGTMIGKRKRGDDELLGLGDGPTQLRFKAYAPIKKQRTQNAGFTQLSSSNAVELSKDRGATSTSETFNASIASLSSAEDSANGYNTKPANNVAASYFLAEHPSQVSPLSEARASGIYSAAALFRKPSTKAKKYTRPPMSKLFSSLQLSPESFLRLQAAAKAYMLDPSHPDRLDCVGNRGKGDSDMVKLRLYHSVREFLETRSGDFPGSREVDATGRDVEIQASVADEGDDLSVGTKFFGPNSEGSSVRGWVWPADATQAICLCTPLLRRMVTNERQRQYALENRKIGGTGTSGDESTILMEVTSKPSGNMETNAETHPAEGEVNGRVLNTAPDHADDINDSSSIRQTRDVATTSSNTTTTTTTDPNAPASTAVAANIRLQIPLQPSPALQLRFSIVRSSPTAAATQGQIRDDQRSSEETLLANFDLAASACRSFEALQAVLTTALHQLTHFTRTEEDQSAETTTKAVRTTGTGTGFTPEVAETTSRSGGGDGGSSGIAPADAAPRFKVNSIKALLPAGLLPVHDKGTWEDAMQQAENLPWMINGCGLNLVVSVGL